MEIKKLINPADLICRLYALTETLPDVHKDLRAFYHASGYNAGLVAAATEVKRAHIVDSMEVPQSGVGDLSDGYHTFNELYHHRAVLFSVICNMHPLCSWKAKKHHDGTMYDGMFVVGINTPEGQATYHYDIDPYWDMFNVPEAEYAPEWDGHTADEAIRRIGLLGATEAV